MSADSPAADATTPGVMMCRDRAAAWTIRNVVVAPRSAARSSAGHGPPEPCIMITGDPTA